MSWGWLLSIVASIWAAVYAAAVFNHADSVAGGSLLLLLLVGSPMAWLSFETPASEPSLPRSTWTRALDSDRGGGCVMRIRGDGNGQLPSKKGGMRVAIGR